MLAEKAAEEIRAVHAGAQVAGAAEGVAGGAVGGGGVRGGAAAAAVSGRIKARTDEGVAEPVTEADQRSNQVLVNGYRQRFPGRAKILPTLVQ